MNAITDYILDEITFDKAIAFLGIVAIVAFTVILM